MKQSENMEKKLLSFLNKHAVGTIATVSPKNTAHCSTIYYFADERLHFYFLTKSNSIKCANISKNPNVALTVSDEKKLQTVQIEGAATVIKDTDMFNEAVQRLKVIQYGRKHIANPPINKLYGEFVFYEIVPRWIRWVDYNNKWTDTSIYESTE